MIVTSQLLLSICLCPYFNHIIVLNILFINQLYPSLSHQLTLIINQLSTSISFFLQSTFLFNLLYSLINFFFSVDFLYQSIFFINGLYMSMDISLSVNWLDSSLAQLIKIFKTFSLVIQHVLLRLKKVTC